MLRVISKWPDRRKAQDALKLAAEVRHRVLSVIPEKAQP
jgi:hypothetical protein